MSEEQRTQMLERPQWLEVERQRILDGRSTGRFEVSNQRGMSRAMAAAEAGERGPATGGPLLEQVSEEATSLFDPSLLRRSHRMGAIKAPSLPLLDGRRARPVDLQRLAQVSCEEVEGLALLSELLPSEVSMGEVEEVMSGRLTELIGASHQVKWAGLSAGDERDLWEVQSGGLLTWGRALPGPHRVFVGASRALVRAWVKAIGGSSVGVGGEFEDGLATFLLAELFGTFTERVEWPLLSWGVNPVRAEEVEALIQMEEAPLVELVFSISFEGGVRSPVHLWLPGGALRQVQASREGAAAVRLSGGGWWEDLVMRRPIIAGSTALSLRALERLEVGDILLVERHGVRAEEFEESVSEDGARWLVGSEHVLRGMIFDDGSGSWSFEMVREGRDGAGEEVEMSDAEGVGQVAIEEARVQVDIRIGMIELDLGSLARVRPGQVIDCGEPVGGAVDLVVSGAAVGRGELVAVDGRLGVRILRMASGVDQL